MARTRLTGLPRLVRRTRAASFGLNRALGNAQPFVDLLGSGRVDLLALGIGRRYARRKVGGLFSRAEFGNGSLWKAILGMILGRAVGKIGRW